MIWPYVEESSMSPGGVTLILVVCSTVMMWQQRYSKDSLSFKILCLLLLKTCFAHPARSQHISKLHSSSYRGFLVQEILTPRTSRLGCSIVLGPTGAELLDSKWIAMKPFGFISPCLPYGLDHIFESNCNNPFYLNLTRKSYSTSSYQFILTYIDW